MDDQIKQHQRLARKGGDPQESGNFGVDMHNHKNNANSEPKVARKKALSESERGVPGGRSYHPEPNHGPTKSP